MISEGIPGRDEIHRRDPRRFFRKKTNNTQQKSFHHSEFVLKSKFGQRGTFFRRTRPEGGKERKPMDKIRRNERMSVLMKTLSCAPNRIFTLNSFCDLFGSAKSTLSEDVDLLREVCETFDLGAVETVTGAAGGVRYRPAVSRKKARETIRELCEKLSGTERVLPG